MNFLDFLFASTLLVSVGVGAWRGWMPQALTLLGLLLTVVFLSLSFFNLSPQINLPLFPVGSAFKLYKNWSNFSILFLAFKTGEFRSAGTPTILLFSSLFVEDCHVSVDEESLCI